MRTSWQQPKIEVIALACLAAAVWLVFAGQGQWTGAKHPTALPRPAGHPQLVSYQLLPEKDGESCEWAPGSAVPNNRSLAVAALMASLRQQSLAGGGAARASDEPRIAVDADRSPARVIRDTDPTYSAIAVDLNSNEVYLQDENLFGYKAFNRLDNTPPAAKFTEPQRVVGGIHTGMEFNCGIYVDPYNGDVYSITNDTADTMVVFPRDAAGNVAPKRELRTPHRTFGIAVDEGNQEIFLTVQHHPAVVVYRKTASGSDQPIRILEGNQTRLEDAHGIAIDVKNKLLFVSNHGSSSLAAPGDSVMAIQKRVAGSGRFADPSITVYPLDAKGNTPPLRVIQGPQTRLNWPAAMFLDWERGELYVANDADNSILAFRATDSGDVAPQRIIEGASTGIKYPTGVFVDTKNRELWVSNMGNHSATVYPLTADGDVAPLRTIRSAPLGKQALAIGNPGAVAYDSKRQEILVPN